MIDDFVQLFDYASEHPAETSTVIQYGKVTHDQGHAQYTTLPKVTDRKKNPIDLGVKSSIMKPSSNNRYSNVTGILPLNLSQIKDVTDDAHDVITPMTVGTTGNESTDTGDDERRNKDASKKYREKKKAELQDTKNKLAKLEAENKILLSVIQELLASRR